MVQVLAFQIYVGAIALAQSRRTIEGRRTPYIVTHQAVELGHELRVGNGLGIGLLQVVDIGLEDLGDVCAAERSVKALVVNEDVFDVGIHECEEIRQAIGNCFSDGL